ncbi:hypothetical protein BDZ88DRAFT_417222 [Geranomyces variabilis]|nr:hypothetical protein BDZ88DRAFT_417222 [Geranomyces variabilis]
MSETGQCCQGISQRMLSQRCPDECFLMIDSFPLEPLRFARAGTARQMEHAHRGESTYLNATCQLANVTVYVSGQSVFVCRLYSPLQWDVEERLRQRADTHELTESDDEFMDKFSGPAASCRRDLRPNDASHRCQTATDRSPAGGMYFKGVHLMSVSTHASFQHLGSAWRQVLPPRPARRLGSWIAAQDAWSQAARVARARPPPQRPTLCRRGAIAPRTTRPAQGARSVGESAAVGLLCAGGDAFA